MLKQERLDIPRYIMHKWRSSSCHVYLINFLTLDGIAAIEK